MREIETERDAILRDQIWQSGYAAGRAAALRPQPTYEDMVLVHVDGGDCHGTPLVNWRCPKCGIAPDMQSTEFRAALSESAP